MNKVSIITVCSNSFRTLKHTIDSVLEQTYPNIEYVIIDNNSKDGTVDLVKSYGGKISCFISEPDSGMYNAMNKGIRHATGDVVGILNSDDFFCQNDIIDTIMNVFNNKEVDVVYGDVQFIDPLNLNKIRRYYSSRRFNPKKFKFGFMPAHPGFYVKKRWFDLLGFYKENYKIAADYELLIRFLFINNLRSEYVGKPFVSMRPGGVSNNTLKSTLILNKEILRACKENGINTNLIYIYSKYFIKIFELFGTKGL